LFMLFLICELTPFEKFKMIGSCFEKMHKFIVYVMQKKNDKLLY
jgi:hypothetical protein